MNVLLTGFGPFLQHRCNFTGWFLEKIFDPAIFNDHFELFDKTSSKIEDQNFKAYRKERNFLLNGRNVHACALGLEVVWEKAALQVIEELQLNSYDLVLMFGLGRQDFVFEAGALNTTTENKSIFAELPPHQMISFTWPTEKLQTEMEDFFASHGFTQDPTRKARENNIYICNELSFRVLNYLKDSDSQAQAGFLHFPSSLQMNSIHLEMCAKLTKKVLEICQTSRQTVFK